MTSGIPLVAPPVERSALRRPPVRVGLIAVGIVLVAATQAIATWSPLVFGNGVVVRGYKDVGWVIVSHDQTQLQVGYTKGWHGGDLEPGSICSPGTKVSVVERADQVEIILGQWIEEPLRPPWEHRDPEYCASSMGTAGDLTVTLARPLDGRAVIANGRPQWLFHALDPPLRQLPGGFVCRDSSFSGPALTCLRGTDPIGVHWRDPDAPPYVDPRELRWSQQVDGISVDVSIDSRWRPRVRWPTPRGMAHMASDGSVPLQDLLALVEAVDAASRA